MLPKELSEPLLSHADKYVILYFWSTGLVGIYAVAYMISSTFRYATTILSGTLYPTISEAWDAGETQEITRIYSIILEVFVILALPALVGVFFVGEELLRLLGTPEIAANGLVALVLLSIGFVIRGIAEPFQYVLTAAHQTRFLGGLLTGVGVGNLLLNILLVPWLGIEGAAVATLTSFVVLALLVMAKSWTYMTPIPRRENISKAAVSTGVMAVVLLFVPSFSPSVDLFANVLVGIVSFSVMALALRMVTLNDLRTVREFIG